MITIPAAALSAEALQGLIEEFVLREGTEYGAREVSLEEKRAAVLRALQRGDGLITFDEDSETTSIVLAEGFRG